MKDFRQFGLVAMCSGLFVTGLLWFMRDSEVPTGEDLAETYNAFAERFWAYQSGTNPAAPSMALCGMTWRWTDWSQTNYAASGVADDPVAGWFGVTGRLPHAVDSHMRWSTIHSRLLSGLRSMVMDEGAGLFWVDPATWPADGQIIASVQAEWQLASTEASSNGMPEIRHWVQQPASNGANQHVGTTSTRKPSDGVRFVNGVTNSHMPVCEWFWGPGTEGTNVPPWPSGNWWTDKLGSTQVFAWACERWETEGLNVNAEAPSHFNVSPQNLFFATADWPNPVHLSVISVETDTNRLYAGVVTLSADGLASQVAAVSDGLNAPTLNIVVSPRYASLTEGGSQTFAIHLAANPGATVQVAAEYVGTGGHLGYTFLLFGPSNWSSDQYSTFYADEDADKLNGAGYLKLTYSGIEHRVAIGVADNDGASDIAVTPLIALAKGSSNAVDVTLSVAPTNKPLAFNYRVAVTNLIEARAVVTNLSQTLALFTPAQAIYSESNAVTVWRQFNGSLSDSEALTYDLTSAYDAWLAGRPAGTLLTNVWDGVLLDADLQLSADQQSSLFSFGPPEDWLYASAAYWQEESYATIFSSEMRLPYPSALACASGKVSRVRIYAVIECSLCDKAVTDPSSFQITDDQASRGWSVDVDEDPATVSWYADKCKVVDFACGYGDTFLQFNASACDLVSGANYPSEIRPVLLADVSDPTEIPAFTLSTDAFTLDLADFHGTGWTVYSYDLSERPSITENWAYEYRNIVSVKYFAVLVDWHFEHTLSGSYSPVLYTPPWATNSP